MRATWEALQRSLVRSVGTLAAKKKFNDLRKRRPSMAPFAGADELVTYLNADGGELDEKDAIYAALVEAVQAEGDDAELATALLWLGLWPGLDALYRRRQRDFVNRPEALVSEIGAHFTTAVRGSDMGRINRVAATLVRNTEREVREGLKRAWAEETRRATLPTEDENDEQDGSTGDLRRARRSLRGLRIGGVSELGQPPRVDVEADVAALRELLICVVGDDVDLVIGAAVYGESQREVGERLGLTHEAARKRFQKAMRLLRRWVEAD